VATSVGVGWLSAGGVDGVALGAPLEQAARTSATTVSPI